ncbi:MAG: PP2C family protein-serine/threonine phosphatase [Candidatus Methylacidiphilales bacterium]|nr:SpoIIE family protein phosphatase [Candidatus Methylacidiphilales bacterium]
MTSSLSSPTPSHTSIILVVDDVAKNIQVVGTMLRAEGYEVMAVTSGAKALERVKTQRPDLILLDLMMPEMDGFEVCRRLKADPTTREIPVVFLTAHTETDMVVEGFTIGAVDYVSKPFKAPELLARVRTHLDLKHSREDLKRAYEELNAANTRLQHELREACTYVESLLPKRMTEPFQIDWIFDPCTELGGDCFGYHWVDKDNFAVYLLDVCGHGVGSALLSVSAANTLRNLSLPGVDFRNPAQVLTALNNAYLMENQNDLTFTIWYAVFNVPTRKLSASAAGHPPSLLTVGPRDGEKKVSEMGEPSMILGMCEGVVYNAQEYFIPEGSDLYVLSDGVYEIARPDGTMLNYDDFAAFLSKPIESPKKNIEYFLEYLKGVGGGLPFEDDFSLLHIRF